VVSDGTTTAGPAEDPAEGPPTGYWIALPDGWVTLDLRKDAAQLRQGLSLAASLAPGLDIHLPQLERMLTTAAADAQRAGVGFTAILTKPLEDDFVLQASLSISGHALGAELGARNDPGSVRRALAGMGPDRDISMFDLPAGAAVRRTATALHPLPGSETEMRMLSDQWYLPIPATTAGIVQLAFGSPTLVLTDELLTLFAAMAASFRFTWKAVPGQAVRGRR